MTTDEIKHLPIEEKIQIMEALWIDLRERFEQADIPSSIRRLLDERRERVRSGQAQPLDWDSIKGTLGQAAQHLRNNSASNHKLARRSRTR